MVFQGNLRPVLREIGVRHHDPLNPQMLTAVVGARLEGRVHAARHYIPLQAGDVLLAATDGLDTLSPEKVAEVVREHPNNTAGHLLETVMREARKREQETKQRTQDNVTVAVLRIGAAHGPEAEPEKTWIERRDRAGGGPLLVGGRPVTGTGQAPHPAGGGPGVAERRALAGRLLAASGGRPPYATDEGAAAYAERTEAVEKAFLHPIRTPWWCIDAADVRRYARN